MYEMYDSVQGESTLAGLPCTFIRLAGCPLRCTYCDTPKAIPTDSGQWVDIDEIVKQVSENNRPLVLVTGGEPLAQRHCNTLLKRLSELNCFVQLETSGAYSIASLPAGIRRIVDIKTPGSGESQRNQLQNIGQLVAGDEIKIVLTGRSDYEWARDFISEHQLGLGDVPVLLSPAWGDVAASELCEWLLEDRLPARMQMQMHKMIWGSEAEGV